MENVVTAIFTMESDAYRAFSEIKHDMLNQSCVISQIALVKKQNGRVVACEGYDSGIHTADDTRAGGLIGMFTGILGGPLGMLFGGAAGTMVGMSIDSVDAVKEYSLIEQVSAKLSEGEVALVALAQESSEEMLNSKLSPYQVSIIRREAAVVAAEIEEAVRLQLELEKETHRRLREAKKEEFKQAVAKKRDELRAHFDALKEKFLKKR